jgi:hypothetical protein
VLSLTDLHGGSHGVGQEFLPSAPSPFGSSAATPSCALDPCHLIRSQIGILYPDWVVSCMGCCFFYKTFDSVPRLGCFLHGVVLSMRPFSPKTSGNFGFLLS